MCGSFCTFSKAFDAARALKDAGCALIPIMSFNAARISTRFGKAEDNVRIFEEIAERKIINSIEEAEPIGPKKMLDILIILNCTGNTLAKLANSITDSPVTMAVKSHLRIGGPVLINIATNDALAGSAKNIAALMNMKNYYFVPFRQDDHAAKPASAAGRFDMINQAAELALAGTQIEPVLLAEDRFCG